MNESMIGARARWIGMGALLPLLMAASAQPQVEVREAFIELHTAPDATYPIFDIAERGERVQILLQRFDWFKVRTATRQEGWVPGIQMRQSLAAAGLLE
ncbi:MAG: SH3 domain-containing protein [Solimonas sp.]